MRVWRTKCCFLVKEEDKTLRCDLGHFAPPDPRWEEMLPAESVPLGVEVGSIPREGWRRAVAWQHGGGLERGFQSSVEPSRWSITGS